MASPRDPASSRGYSLLPDGSSTGRSGSTTVEGTPRPPGIKLRKSKSIEIEDVQQVEQGDHSHEEKISKFEYQESILEEREESLHVQLTNAQLRVKQLQDEIHEVELMREHLAERKRRISTQVFPEKESHVEWAESAWFQGICMSVVLLNTVAMVNEDSIPQDVNGGLIVGFLLFYWFEFILGMMHHGLSFLLGDWHHVWWHWLDLCIVLSGTLDLLIRCTGKCTAFRMIRLFRILRLLKVVRILWLTDLHNLLSDFRFEMFLTGVVCLNAVTMGCELDMPWDGWVIMNNIFLAVYAFDLIIRLKWWGGEFFYHPGDVMWNWLDFVIVCCGSLDLWLLPLVGMVQRQVFGGSSHVEMGNLASLMQVIRLMRLLRVLRLVQVFRRIKPLYKLLRGIKDAVDSMKWVLVVTLIVLYAASIVFTYLVGHGLIYGQDEIPKQAVDSFGTVTQSLFSLFELMNGDIQVVDEILGSWIGRLLFIMFMVVSNWSILAILTSVVSDGMINTTTQITLEENRMAEEQISKEHAEILAGMFAPRDPEETGHISEKVWKEMLEDRHILEELTECSNLNKEELVDLFECLAVEEDHTGATVDDTMVNYHELIRNLKMDNLPADKRSVCHVMMRLQVVQNQLADGIRKNQELTEERFNNLERHLFPSSAKPLATHSTEVNADHRSDNIEIDQLLSSLRMKMLQRRVPD